MADFDKAVKVVLKNEGKFNNDPHDPGHATNYGISLRFLLLAGIDLNKDNSIDIQDILSMNAFQAKQIYKKEWWDKYKYGLIEDQEIATKIFDLSVNMGAYQSHKLAQRALNECRKIYPKVELLDVDGILGSGTRTAINMMNKMRKNDQLLMAIRKQARTFYINLTLSNHNLDKFLKGWLRRAAS